jgi:hypothetical protein
MKVIEEFTVDLGSCLRWGKPTLPCLTSATDTLQSKTHPTAVHFFSACHKIHLLSVVSYVVRDVCKIDFRLFINGTFDQWQPAKRRSCSYKQCHVFDRIYTFSLHDGRAY